MKILLPIVILSFLNAAHAFSFTYSADPTVITVSGLCVAVGLILCFAGYRTFRGTLFVGGFFVGSSVCYSLLQLYAHLNFWFCLGIAAASGLVTGLLLMYLAAVGIWFLGAIFGFLIYVHINSVKDGGLINSPDVKYALEGGLPFVFGVLAIIFQKFLIVLATSFAGAFMIVSGADYFTRGHFSQIIPQIMQGRQYLYTVDEPRTYIELGVIAFLFILGIIIQYRHTSKGYDHRNKKPKDYDLLHDIEQTNVTIQSYNTFSDNVQPPTISPFIKPLPPVPSPTAPTAPPPYPYDAPYQPSRRECSLCKGKGSTQTACGNCLGSGFTPNPINPTSKVICRDCNGKAQMVYKCVYCNGIGYQYN